MYVIIIKIKNDYVKIRLKQIKMSALVVNTDDTQNQKVNEKEQLVLKTEKPSSIILPDKLRNDY